MACPFFMPMQKSDSGMWPHPARLPLGRGWSGHCTAPGHEGHLPTQEAQEKSCNLGYAAMCDWLPAQRPWDAVRFAVVAQKSGMRNHVVHLRYACERDHRPVEHGKLTFEAGAGWVRMHPDVRVQKMAECFLESWMAKNTVPAVDKVAS